MNYFVTAIGTDSGKTLVSAILAEALQADYWKPVQAGLPADSDTVRELLTNSRTRILPEAVRLKMPASPHAAAAAEGRALKLSDIQLPEGARSPLVIEGAGGCLVPLNERDSVIDLVPQLKARVVLVSNHYLGSINHTLLTAELLKERNYPVEGILFNGDAMPGTEEVILERTGYRCLLRLARHKKVDAALVQMYAQQIKKNLYA
ncbi:dethiobiotin synthase [Nafulsella turpanensis]|uniref:dethiobiotin synthase n=1 Tax=Nafulsella turpanensis TaxID=1265690 RepID=UPI000347F61C|nr:dethiobiotin synthase [Nafulsella turpanensis]